MKISIRIVHAVYSRLVTMQIAILDVFLRQIIIAKYDPRKMCRWLASSSAAPLASSIVCVDYYLRLLFYSACIFNRNLSRIVNSNSADKTPSGVSQNNTKCLIELAPPVPSEWHAPEPARVHRLLCAGIYPLDGARKPSGLFASASTRRTALSWGTG